jgi:predicted amidophosphoribosyltransferase
MHNTDCKCKECNAWFEKDRGNGLCNRCGKPLDDHCWLHESVSAVRHLTLTAQPVKLQARGEE